MPDCLIDEDCLSHSLTSTDWLSLLDTNHHRSSSYALSPTSMDQQIQAPLSTDHVSPQLCPTQRANAPSTGALDCEQVANVPSCNIPLADQPNYCALPEGSSPAHANTMQCSHQPVLAKHALITCSAPCAALCCLPLRVFALTCVAICLSRPGITWMRDMRLLLCSAPQSMQAWAQ